VGAVAGLASVLPRRGTGHLEQDGGDGMLDVNAVLLDLDGTLLDHEGASQRAVLTAARAWFPETVPLSPADVISAWQELEATHMAAYLSGAVSFAAQRRGRVRGLLERFGVPSSTRDAEVDEMFRSYLTAYEASWTAFRDVDEAMGQLWQAPGGVAVLSNGDRAQQEAKLAALNLQRVPRLFVPADVGAAKPDAASFRNACRAMGWEPADVFYVGDNLETDARAAAAAGLTGCWLDRYGTDGDDALQDGVIRVPDLLRVRDAMRCRAPTQLE
jgi:putative hydrolase of the HAD superfamily